MNGISFYNVFSPPRLEQTTLSLNEKKNNIIGLATWTREIESKSVKVFVSYRLTDRQTDVEGLPSVARETET